MIQDLHIYTSSCAIYREFFPRELWPNPSEQQHVPALFVTQLMQFSSARAERSKNDLLASWIGGNRCGAAPVVSRCDGGRASWTGSVCT